MASKHAIKDYFKGASYHVYNRGVNKDKIFYSSEDYKYFMYLLDRYLLPVEIFDAAYKPVFKRKVKNYSERVRLHAFCLMPNHFHFLLEQEDANAMQEFMQSMSISYTMFINKKYNRVGHLFQERYKARLVGSNDSFVRTAYYIHQNPVEICSNVVTYEYSSLNRYNSAKSARFKFLYTRKLKDIMSSI